MERTMERTIETLTTVFECPGLFASEDPVEDPGVDHAAVQAKVIVEGRPDVSDRAKLFPHPRVLQSVGVLGRVEAWEEETRKKEIIHLRNAISFLLCRRRRVSPAAQGLKQMFRKERRFP